MGENLATFRRCCETRKMLCRMSEIDRQRIAAVSVLEALGYEFRSGRWYSPLDAAGGTGPWPEADQLHAILIARADALIGCPDGSAAQDELVAIGEALEAYEGRRWPQGRADRGKG